MITPADKTMPGSVPILIRCEKDASGYETTRVNALRHGMLSRYTVLPWEDEREYRALLDALVAERAAGHISSRSWPVSYGASGGYAWPRLPRTIAGWRAR